MNKIKRYIPIIMIVIILAVVFTVWITNPITFEVYENSSNSYLRGTVIAIHSQDLEPSTDLEGRYKGSQELTVRLSDKREVSVTNRLSDASNVIVDVGTRVIVICEEPEGSAANYFIYSYDRTFGIIIAFAIFIGVICLVGKLKGLYTAIALILSMTVIIAGLIPAIFNGHSPVIATVLACVAISTATLVLLNGFSKKTAAAILSTLIGLAASTLLYGLMEAVLSLTGYEVDEVDQLIAVKRNTGLKIGELLFSSILLSSLGAVMDTAMSIASALFEMAENQKSISPAELYKSGMNIGRDMIGTMCQTLVLAFTGGSVVTIILVLANNGTDFHRFLSSNFLASEILQALTGSFAVILTVPITASFCATLHKKKKKSSH